MTETSITELQPPTRGAWYQERPLRRNSLAPPSNPIPKHANLPCGKYNGLLMNCAAEGPAALNDKMNTG